MKFLFLSLFLTPSLYASWNLNDVSYLFKLPTSEAGDSSSLLQTTSQGPKGELLKRSVFDILPTLNMAEDGPDSTYNNLRVLGVRVDPCPANLENKCYPEVRMVWQRVVYRDYYKKWSTTDAAVHSFYRLTNAEFEKLKIDLQNLKKWAETKNISTENKPLFIHPALQSQKYGKEFNSKIQAILLKYAGDENLYNLTFMSLLTPIKWWKFSGFQKIGNEWKLTSIPTLNSHEVDVFNDDNTVDPETKLAIGMDAMINILPIDFPKSENIHPVINYGWRSHKPDRDLYKSKLEVVHRFRNPLHTSPATHDCAHCHFADATKLYISKVFPELKNHQVDDYQNPNSQKYNLENITIAPKSTKILRAFGYFADRPAINQRTINDSAESAHWLNKQL